MKATRKQIAALAAGEPCPVTEDETQAVIVDGLRAMGYTVFVTSRRARKCPRCGDYSHLGDGATMGLADLIVRSRFWPKGVAVMLEVKKAGPIKYSSTEQKLAAEFGEIVVVQSFEQANAECERVGKALVNRE